jgi:hypothetical protein
MRLALRRFRRDSQGSLSVEAVLMAPMLIMSLFFIFTIFDIFRLDTTNAKAAYTIGDLLSRQTDPVDQNFVDGMRDIYNYIVRDNNTSVRVSVVRFDGDDAEFKLVWSHGSSIDPLTDAEFQVLKNSIPAMTEEDIVIVVETNMPYSVQIPFFNGLNTLNFHNVVVTRPRFASQLCWQSCS